MCPQEAFTELEVKILKQIVPRAAYPPQKKYSEIANIFNSKLEQQGYPAYKSGRAIRSKLTQLYRKEKIPWTIQMEKITISCVSEGMKWKEIAQEPIFRANKVESKNIKSRFESNMRYKFRIIDRYACPENINLDQNLSDKAFRTILTGSISETISNAFNQEENYLLQKIRQYFKIPLFCEDGEKLKLRSKKTDEKMLSALDQCGYEPKQILETLTKLKYHILGQKVENSSQLFQKISSCGHQFELYDQFFEQAGGQEHQDHKFLSKSLTESQKLAHSTSLSTVQSPIEIQFREERLENISFEEVDFFESFSVAELLNPLL